MNGYTMIYAPHRGVLGDISHLPRPIVFLAGSIEMGKARPWQEELATQAHANATYLNPRRPDWDASWEQSKDNPQFRRQVEWELEGLDWADLIAMWLEPGTISPISLLELGLHLRSSRVIIGCPPGFARKGNVDITAARYGIAVCESWNDFVAEVGARIRNHRGHAPSTLTPLI